MLTTEEEANKKACCNETDGTRCAASACMAWRWWDAIIYDVLNRNDIKDTSDLSQRRGYCGLAGQVEDVYLG